MTIEEANLLADAYTIDYRESWEKIRWSAYIMALSNGAKLKKPKDIIVFSWESEDIKDTRTPEEIRIAQLKMIEAMNKRLTPEDIEVGKAKLIEDITQQLSN